MCIILYYEWAKKKRIKERKKMNEKKKKDLLLLKEAYDTLMTLKESLRPPSAYEKENTEMVFHLNKAILNVAGYLMIKIYE